MIAIYQNLFITFSALYLFTLIAPFIGKLIKPLHKSKYIDKAAIMGMSFHGLSILFAILAIITGFLFSSAFGLLYFVAILFLFAFKETFIVILFRKKYNKNNFLYQTRKSKELNVFYPFVPKNDGAYEKIKNACNELVVKEVFYWHLVLTKDDQILISNRKLPTDEVQLIEKNTFHDIFSKNLVSSNTTIHNVSFFNQLKIMPLANYTLIINNYGECGRKLIDILLDHFDKNPVMYNNVVIGTCDHKNYDYLVTRRRNNVNLVIASSCNECYAFVLSSVFYNSCVNANYHGNLMILPTKKKVFKWKINLVREFMCVNAWSNRSLIVYYDNDLLYSDKVNSISKVELINLLKYEAQGIEIKDFTVLKDQILGIKSELVNKKAQKNK